MSRVTSRKAYKELNEEGKARSQKDTILFVISMIPDSDKDFGMSLKEIVRQTGYEINAVSGRVNDLKKDGSIEECTKRKCRITGRPVSYTHLTLPTIYSV